MHLHLHIASVHVHIAGVDFLKELAHLNERVNTMATKQEVLDAIAQEKAQVAEAIKALEDKIASGAQITPADLDDIKNAVGGIYEPAAPETQPEVPPVG